MRIVIAPGSFKECASAVEVAQAIATGVRRAMPDAELTLLPMADGGEGTVDALVAATGGHTVECTVTGPLGAPVSARYGILGGEATAVIEMAAASGFALVPADRRDPRVTTTFGTGELIRNALNRGLRRIIVGIGGSATNDAGAGMAQALGYRLLDVDGTELPRGGAALAGLARIDSAGKHPALEASDIRVACDVTNPLCGERGASCTYGPQKGASPETALALDAALNHFGHVIETQLGIPVLDLPGGGAAGGLGAGLVAFTGARLQSGLELVAAACRLEELLQGASLVITGEGRLDAQTAHGKTPVGVARLAKRHGARVVAIAGAVAEDSALWQAHGIDAAFSICSGPMSLADALRDAPRLIQNTAETVCRLWCSATPDTLEP